MTTKNLLVELFVEELPPKALKKLGEAFAGGIAASLKAQGLVADAAAFTPFASPRRLALHLKDVAPKAADRAVQTHGGNGITQEYGMAGLLVATRAGRIAPVSREMILNYVAMHSLGLPKSY